MKRYVTDTHPLIWALSNDPRLSPAAQAAFAEADAGQAIIIIPPIVAVEMVYLSEKSRIPAHLVDDLLAKVSQHGFSYRLGELSIAVLEALRQIPRHIIPEMPDRIIAATARALGATLITRNGVITASRLVPVVW